MTLLLALLPVQEQTPAARLQGARNAASLQASACHPTCSKTSCEASSKVRCKGRAERSESTSVSVSSHL